MSAAAEHQRPLGSGMLRRDETRRHPLMIWQVKKRDETIQHLFSLVSERDFTIAMLKQTQTPANATCTSSRARLMWVSLSRADRGGRINQPKKRSSLSKSRYCSNFGCSCDEHIVQGWVKAMRSKTTDRECKQRARPATCREEGANSLPSLRSQKVNVLYLI